MQLIPKSVMSLKDKGELEEKWKKGEKGWFYVPEGEVYKNERCWLQFFLNECLPKAVDEVVSPVHLFGHSQLSHVHFSVNVV